MIHGQCEWGLTWFMFPHPDSCPPPPSPSFRHFAHPPHPVNCPPPPRPPAGILPILTLDSTSQLYTAVGVESPTGLSSYFLSVGPPGLSRNASLLFPQGYGTMCSSNTGTCISPATLSLVYSEDSTLYTLVGGGWFHLA